MLKQISPRLGRFNVVSNSFTSCISNASKEFSWTPEMPFGEIISQPGMFLHQFESTVPLEQLQCFANTHSCWHFNKQMDMVNSNMQLINFKSILESGLPNKKLTIHPNPIEIHGVSRILALPNKVEGILPKGMFKTFQIHFISPQNIAHAKSVSLVSGTQQSLSHISRNHKLKFTEGRIPPMFENMGTLRQM